jgi:hypothetical protein
MSQPVSSLRNIGPAFEAQMAEVGITSAEQLIELGADEAYRLLLKAGQRPHFIAFYVLHMALQGRPWNDCKGAEKKALRVKFDALKAANHDKGRSDFEAALDAIGVVEKKA